MSSEAIFVHTADWQIGKPFASIADNDKRSMVQRERLAAIQRIGTLAEEHNAKFVLIAGDLFDSITPTKPIVSATCKAIGDLRIPVYAIPGNHDYWSIESIWEQKFFRHEQAQLAPNFHLLKEAQPFEAPGAWIFPCPLQRRQTTTDPTTWLRNFPVADFISQNPQADEVPWIVLAHGSIQGFDSSSDEEDLVASTPNQIELSRLPERFDYIALGDWHGMKQINERAYYSGTHECDRFPKGEDYQSGYSLIVKSQRRMSPVVIPQQTGKLNWHRVEFNFLNDESLIQFEQNLTDRLASRVDSDLLRLELSGMLGLNASEQLAMLIETWESRLLRVKRYNWLTIAPTDQEIKELELRPDPLIAQVASRLNEISTRKGENADLANAALRQLFQLCRPGA